MKNLRKQILKIKQKEVKDIRRHFKEEILKAAAFSVGGEFRSIEVDIKSSSTLPLLVELKSILSAASGAGGEFLELEGFEPLSVASRLARAGLKSGVVVATDRTFLGGDPAWINLVKNNSQLAVLQRDYFIDAAQMYQGKAIGADGYLINAHLIEKKALAEVIRAGGEMGLEVYLELDELRFPPDLDAESINGLVINLPRQGKGELPLEQLKAFTRSLPPNPLKIARFYPRSEAEVLSLREPGFQALILNGEFWQQADFVRQFQLIHSWCAGVNPGQSYTG